MFLCIVIRIGTTPILAEYLPSSGMDVYAYKITRISGNGASATPIPHESSPVYAHGDVTHEET